jgi:hypothetical protein
MMMVVYVLPIAGTKTHMEDTWMPKTVEDLRAAVEACAEGDKKCVDDAKRDFTRDGGKQGKQEGGKVFSDTTGGKVFVTDGGKVF